MRRTSEKEAIAAWRGLGCLIGMVLLGPAACWAQGAGSPPLITSVANAFGNSATIAPNTWVAIKGSGLSPAGDSRIWLSSDFTGSQMPTALDGVSVTLNGESAYMYYISPTQLNILTPPDLASGTVQVQVTANGKASAAFTAQAQPLSPSFFVFDSTQVVAAHLNGTDIGPTTLYPGLTTPAQPGEEVVLYANGFGPTSSPVVKGSETQSGMLPVMPLIQIGGVSATVLFAGLVSPGLYQFNVIVPMSAANGDNTLTAQYNGQSTQTGVVLTTESNNPPAVQSVTLSASSVAVGGTVQGTVTISAAAPSGGVVVTLSSSSSAGSVPSTVTIPAGSTSATFTVSASTVTTNQTVTITATYSGSSSQAVLTVIPAAAAAFVSLLSTVTFQPVGYPSSQLVLQVTPNAGNGTYTASIEAIPLFINGSASNQNQTFTFNTLSSDTLEFSFAGSVFPLQVSSASLTFTLAINQAESDAMFANGTLTGTLSVTGIPVDVGGAAVTASGAIVGSYSATLAP